MRKLICIFAGMALFLVGCSSSTPVNEPPPSPPPIKDANPEEQGLVKEILPEEKQDLTIDQVPISVEDRIVFGQRMLSASFINNSDYPITSISISYRLKADAVLEELPLEEGETLDKERAEVVFFISEIDAVENGESSDWKPGFANGGVKIENVEDLNKFFEPDILTIRYPSATSSLPEQVFYDYNSQKYFD